MKYFRTLKYGLPMSMASNPSEDAQTTNPLADLTGFQRDLLTIIAKFDESPSGQQIKDRWEDEHDQETTHGRLYPNLDTLEDNDLMVRGEKDRRTNYYELSSEGRETLEEYRAWVSA